MHNEKIPSPEEIAKAEEMTNLSPTQRKMTDEQVSRLENYGASFVFNRSEPLTQEEKEKWPGAYQAMSMSGMVKDGRKIELRQVLNGERSYGVDWAYSGSIDGANIPQAIARQLFDKYANEGPGALKKKQSEFDKEAQLAQEEVAAVTKPVDKNVDQGNPWDDLI